MLTKQLREMERQSEVVNVKKKVMSKKVETTFVDSWLSDVNKIVKKFDKENLYPKWWTIMQKYDWLVDNKVIKAIK